jgi:hypothetical protein
MSKTDHPALIYATRISLNLGESWRPERGQLVDGSDAYLIRHPQRTIKLHLKISPYRREGRLVISGVVPKELIDHRAYNENPKHEISVAVDRQSQDIAKEIRRRLLPAYKEELDILTKRQKTYLDQKQKDEALQETLVSALDGGNPYTMYLNDGTAVIRENWNRQISVHAIGHDSDVIFTVRVPADEALGMARVINTEFRAQSA